MSILRRVEKSLDRRLRKVFAGSREEPGAREAIELYRDALDQIAARATVGKRGDHVFPFDLISVELEARDPERKAVLETLFEPGQLVDDIRATLSEEKIVPPANLTVSVQFPADAAVEMRIRCEKNERPSAAPQAAGAALFIPAHLTVITGIANVPEFAIGQPHVNVGRDSEVVDSMGRTLRRNDLFFPEGAHEANGSISRSHAHIRFDQSAGEWRLYDDGSTLGTSIFRDGRRVEAPAHSARGVLLRNGDEISLGQVLLRFSLGT